MRRRAANNSKQREAFDSSHDIDFDANEGDESQKSILYRKSLFSALLCFVVLILLTTFAYTRHYHSLPDVLDNNAKSNLFSESRAKNHVRKLSEIGRAWAGTKNSKLASDYLQRELFALKELSEELGVSDSRVPLIDVEIQQPSGSFEFTILGGFMTNMYNNLTNVVATFHFGGRQTTTAAAAACGVADVPSILVNSHFDTPLDTESAMDARAPVSVMLEAARALLFADLVTSGECGVRVIFLFNGGEEALQMASKGFITQHPLASTVRTVLNLDTAGIDGPEILFQNGGVKWLRAYREAAVHPHGSSLGADFFKTGIIQSDTDYRIFVDQNITGLDWAFYHESYSYHTPLDTYERMCHGCLQHEGDNLLAYLKHLVSNQHLLLSSETTNDDANNTADTEGVYFDILQLYFVVYSFRTATIINCLCVALLIAVIWLKKLPISGKHATQIIGGTLFIPIILGVLYWIIARFVWFARPFLITPLFVVPTIAYYAHRLQSVEQKQIVSLERHLLTIQAIFYASLCLLLTFFGVGSAYNHAFLTFSYAIVLATCNTVAHRPLLLSYLLPSVVQAALVLPNVFGLFDMVVPLLGRLGDIPGDVVIGAAIGILDLHMVLLFAPLLARFSPLLSSVKRVLLATWLITLLSSVVLLHNNPFTADRPKRVFLQHAVRLNDPIDFQSSLETSKIFLALCDGGPEKPLLSAIEANLRQVSPHSLLADLAEQSFRDDSSNDDQHKAAPLFSRWQQPLDFDTIFPFNFFLQGYTVDAPPIVTSRPATLSLVQRTFDERSNTTSLTLTLDKTNHELVSMRFRADLLEWSLTTHQPHLDRGWYVMRAVAGRGGDSTYTFDMTLRGRPSTLRFHLGAVRFQRSDFYSEFLTLLPDWSTLVAFSSFYSTTEISLI